MTAKFTYEARPCVPVPGWGAKSDEAEADFWSVHERPVEPDEYNSRLAIWIADFARKEDALVFRQLMEDNS